MFWQRRRSQRTTRQWRGGQALELLEGRALLATVTVNAARFIRYVDTQLLGVNLTWWDTNLNTARTQQMVKAAGLKFFRFPGGSSSDTFHLNAPPTYNGEGTHASMASFIGSVGGQAVVTLDYGSGSPQEAAALLAYLNGKPGSTTAIGPGLQWSDSAKKWVSVDWKTAGYWASLRAAAPLTQNDGLNYLRLNHPAPFGFKYFEVGNEIYGSWETDHHGETGDSGRPHDPATYVAFAKAFGGYAAQISPGISIGYDVGDPYAFNNWTDTILKDSAAQGFTPGFLSDHSYVQAPGSENDSNLLFKTFSNPKSLDDWVTRGNAYVTLLKQDLGAAGKNVELLATEFNSVYSNPGKQTTSLVNGLSVADSLGVLMTSWYNGANIWALRNSWEPGNNNSSSLYGWRQGGDYGILGDPTGTPPSSGTYVPYPTYFAEELASKIIQPGGKVAQVSSDDVRLPAYGVLEPNGHLDLLVINKSLGGPLTATFQVSGFQPSTTATLWQYGPRQDSDQRHTSDGGAALAQSTITLNVTASTFSTSFPAFSMSVLDLGPA
jgi:hypothetical protein